MHNILCLNKISPLGTDRLGENYTYAAEIENPERTKMPSGFSISAAYV